MTSPDPALITALGDRFEFGPLLGQGGMAEVYRAEDHRTGRSVAVKVLRRELAMILGSERFQREIAIAARLNHPHILPLLEAGEVTGQFWYATPLISEGSLRDRLRRERQLSFEEVMRLTDEIAGALDHAHHAGIVHRDLKPENILLQDGHALVADFGIAKALDAVGAEKLTETGLALGTPEYMSPEQGTGFDPVDPRSDVYSLGCLVYEMLVGGPPFTGTTARAIQARHAIDTPPPIRSVRPTVPAGVEAAILRALHKVPADRFATAGEFAQALASPDPTPTVPAQPPRSRSARGVWITAAALCAMTVGVVTWRSFGHGSATGLDPRLYLACPFQVRGADPAIQGLDLGTVELLAAKLGGTRELRLVDAGLSQKRCPAGEATTDESGAGAARAIGAGRAIIGSVIGTPTALTFTARVLDAASGTVLGRGEVGGPFDSLPALVDRLAIQLLAGEIDESSRRLTALTSASLPALMAYLSAQRAYHAGEFATATAEWRRALEIDSTFALAAVRLVASNFINEIDREPRQRAWALRGRLGPTDSLILAAALPAGPSGLVSFSVWAAAWKRVTRAAPELKEAWYVYGDRLFHEGGLFGPWDAARRQSADAFDRALALDSTFIPALEHRLELALVQGDTALARRLAERYRALHPASDNVGYVDWRIGVVLGDSLLRSRAITRFDSLGTASQARIARYALTTGQGVEDLELLPGTPDIFYNRGQASRVTTSTDRDRVLNTLFWDDDPALGGAAVVRLATSDSISDRFAVQLWRLVHGDTTGAARTVADLRAASAGAPIASVPNLKFDIWARLLELLEATESERPEAASFAAALDSAWWLGYHLEEVDLVLMQVWERLGRPEKALAMAAHTNFPDVRFLSTRLREEARLAAQLGDRPRAVRAARHYLALRTNPDPRLVPDRDSVRALLARLTSSEPR